MNTTDIEAKDEVFLILDNSCTVSQSFYTGIREQVTDIFPALLPDVEYTLQMLCGPEFWESLTDGERRLAGKCMVDMVKNELVPYTDACKSCQSPKVYTANK
jgi:hypothetical protein